ncbi:tyrosine-type recombinase/integrase [Rhizobium sp. CB3060]|uniref:tyrosine-type recombinase/integrase n=1 Tax=Rhizobium sp. CB3060 TaxID=3138255 RepID=UPI0021A4883F|nr:tyrosine-type recombinase/integrase [Rhizobium tropici]
MKAEITERTEAIRFSLRTRDRGEARRRKATAETYLDKYFAVVRLGRPVELSHKQTLALAGELYRAWASEPDEMPNAIYMVEGLGLPTVPPVDFDAEAVQLLGAALAVETYVTPEKGAERLELFGPVASIMLSHKGIPYVPTSVRERLVLALCRALSAALKTRARYAMGDYTPDDTLAKYPAWEPPKIDQAQAVKPSPIHGTVSLTGLVDAWWMEAKQAGRSEATYLQFKGIFKQLARFLGHDDARMVTTEDIVRFKEDRLSVPRPRTGKLMSARSLKHTHLSVYKSIFKWAVANFKLTSNPASGVTLVVPKRVKVRARDFTPVEAGAILSAASALDNIASPSSNEVMCRWVPWLCAYTGCRVGEAIQLRKEDIRFESGTWIIKITPEAGPVKNKELREVPLHVHLVELGFTAFVKKATAGYLFIELGPEANLKQILATRTARLGSFARQCVKDPNVSPNHGWRHTFKSRGFEAGIQEKVLDAICGHAPSSIGRQYGSVTMKTLVDAMKLFPRYELGKQNNAR